MKSILVIGLGEFGTRLARKMSELKNDVMVVDIKAERVEALAPYFPDAQICDCTNMDVLRSLGINNFDICFVAIGENFQVSLEITSLLKEAGAKRIISKASSDIHAKFLSRIGADEVVFPERDTALKLATRCNASNILDYIELSSEYSIFEIPVPREWVGKSIGVLNIRRKYHLNVLAAKRGNGDIELPSAEYEFDENDNIVALGTQADIKKITDR